MIADTPNRRPAGPPASPGNLLKQAALTWHRELGRRLRPIGLTPTQFFLLGSAGWLGRDGTEPSQQAVADFAGVDRMMASKVLGALAEAGLVERKPDPTDGRASRLSVTTAGHGKRARAVQIVTELDQAMFGALDEARLMDDLRTLAAFGTLAAEK